MTFREFLFGKKEPPKGKISKAAQWQDNSTLPVKIAEEAKTESEWNLVEWLDKILEQDIPEEVCAFCINLYDDGDGAWALELIGTKRFAPDDEDWGCDEVTDFGTRENPFRWEQHLKWEDVQTNIRDVVHSYICDVGKYRDKLFSKDAVGVGFVDGNIELVYSKRPYAFCEWDEEGFSLHDEYELSEKSDLADALRVFYTLGGYSFLQVKDPQYYSANWLEFMGNLYAEIDGGKYKASESSYAIPLTDSQKTMLANQGVPEVFLVDKA